MLLCQGRAIRPGHVEPCPDNRRDESVRNRQGDLYLCDACTEFRFPDTVDIGAATNRRGKSKPPVTTNRSATTTRSTTRRGPLVN